MGKLYLIGLGVYPTYLTLQGLEVLKKCEFIFLEDYTSPIPSWCLEYIKNISGKNVVKVCRKDLEDDEGRVIFEKLEKGCNVALLVPGDPAIATTHNVLRIEACKRGHEVVVIHGVSILSSVISLVGLSPYRFGPVVTITYPRMNVYSLRPYEVVKDNLERNLHTLLLLDVSDDGKFMTINEALKILRVLEEKVKGKIFTEDRIIIGIARVGFPDTKVHVDTLTNLENYDFGEPPHVMIIPAKLHFIEYEVLIHVHKCNDELLKELLMK